MLLSAIVPWAIYSDLDLNQPLLDARLLSWPFLLGCLGLLLLYFAADGLRLYFTLRALGYQVPLRALSPLVFINILVSNITPMATGGGLAQVWYLRRHGVHLGAATAATTLRTLQAVLFIFLPTPFLLFFMTPLHDSAIGDRIALYLGLFACLYIAFFAVVLLRLGWILLLLDPLLRLLVRLRLLGDTRMRRWHFRLRREMIRFRGAIRAFFRGRRDQILLALACTALFLLALFSFPALLLWGLDYSIDYLTSLGLLVVTTFVMYFSPTPGAAGVAEGVFGLFFSALVQSGDLLLIIVLWRFLTVHLGMLIGVPLTLRSLLPTGDRHG